MDKETVENITREILGELYVMQEYSAGRAILSRLRSSIGRDFTNMADVMPFLFQKLPEDFLGKGDKPGDKEISILTCLQLYAIYQQGEKKCVFEGIEGYSNIGTSLKSLRVDDDNTAVDRRFKLRDRKSVV